MRKNLTILALAAVLSACGGGGDAITTTETTEAPVPSAAPGATLDTGLPGGYSPDGTIPPATEPDIGIPISPTEPLPSTKPCKIPQASDQGIEHGQPPVGRCA